MGKTDSRTVTEFLHEIAGWPLQCRDNPFGFELVLAEDHTRCEEVIDWLAGQDVEFTVLSTYGDSLRNVRVEFDNHMQAAIFKTRFVSHG